MMLKQNTRMHTVRFYRYKLVTRSRDTWNTGSILIWIAFSEGKINSHQVTHMRLQHCVHAVTTFASAHKTFASCSACSGVNCTLLIYKSKQKLFSRSVFYRQIKRTTMLVRIDNLHFSVGV
jgi:hypothetical protein